MKRVLRGIRRPRPEGREEWPEAVILFAGAGSGAGSGPGRALQMFPGEARAWRALAEREIVRARAWRRDGRAWDAGVCAGRAEAYRAAAEQVENVLIEAFELWDQYEERAGEGT